jgi:hypothetical protein
VAREPQLKGEAPAAVYVCEERVFGAGVMPYVERCASFDEPIRYRSIDNEKVLWSNRNVEKAADEERGKFYSWH